MSPSPSNSADTGQRLRQAVDEERPLQMVGVPNAYCALLAQRVGFRGIYLSGAGVANVAYGRPDLGLTSRAEVVEEARRITAVTSLPLLVDVDTGWGDEIVDCVQELEQASAAGLQLEDQVDEKRCGHRPGKVLVSIAEMQARLTAALAARQNNSFVIMARTDAGAVEGLTAAIDRSLAYVETGADMIFVEALTSLDEYHRFTEAVQVPVLANLTEFGQTPLFDREQMAQSGVSVLLYPLSAFRVMSKSVEALYASIRTDGTQRAWLEHMQSREELYELLDYHTAELAQDAQHKKDRQKMAQVRKQPSGGLADIVAGDSAICTVGKQGHGLSYRGYAIEDLTASACFEEVAYLLLYGKLPTTGQLDAYLQRLSSLRKLPEELKAQLEMLPASSHPMDVLRSGCSLLGCIEPEHSFDEQYNIADRLLATLPVMLLYWYGFHKHGKRMDSVMEIAGETINLAGSFLHLLHGKAPTEIQQRALDASLILYAEHEFNASTFAARVTASTLADFYSCITSAIGTLRGPLHGGANEATMAFIADFSDPDAAEEAVLAALASHQKVMGFGHRVYRESDPRNTLIKAWSKRLSDDIGDGRLFAVSERIEQVMWREKKLFANLDFYSASVYHFLAIPVSLYTPVFVCARVAGWAAHVMEQRQHNRLIRPTANYIGPDERSFVPLGQR
ncbi:MAG: 2-methylcitrate synthase [Gammaproteobacteria bacterium]|nr:2-methylcitrate synthase [Gammaproteobacteria bacterium]